MSNDSRKNPGNTPSGQDQEAVELLRRLLIQQSASSGLQIPLSTAVQTPHPHQLLALLRLPPFNGREDSSLVSRGFPSAVGAVGPAAHSLHPQLLLDALLRQGQPALQPHQGPLAGIVSGLGHHPATVVNVALNGGLAPESQQTYQPSPLTLGMEQQLALLVRQHLQHHQGAVQAPASVAPPASALLGSQVDLLTALTTLNALAMASAPPHSVATALGHTAVLPSAAVPQLLLQGSNRADAQATLAGGFANPPSTEASSQPSATLGTYQGSPGARGTPPPTSAETFPLKLYRLVTEAETSGKDDVVSFTRGGSAFRIHHPPRFVREILPLYFRHQRFDSFKRQLCNYGFNRISVGADEGAFEHRLFKKGRPELVQQMRRVSVEQQQRRNNNSNNRNVAGIGAGSNVGTGASRPLERPPRAPPPSGGG